MQLAVRELVALTVDWTLVSDLTLLVLGRNKDRHDQFNSIARVGQLGVGASPSGGASGRKPTVPKLVEECKIFGEGEIY